MRVATQSGLGATGATDIREIPSWCSYVPFSDYMDTCQPYTPQELQNMTRSQIEYIYRSLPPEQAEPLTEAAIDRVERSAAAGAATDPIGSCHVKAWLENPTLVKLLGPGAYCTPEGKYASTANWLLIGALVAGGLMLVSSLRR